VNAIVNSLCLIFFDYLGAEFCNEFGIIALYPLGRDFVGVVACCLKSLSMLKSRPSVWWLPLRPGGNPNGKYHVAWSAAANLGLPALGWGVDLVRMLDCMKIN